MLEDLLHLQKYILQQLELYMGALLFYKATVKQKYKIMQIQRNLLISIKKS